MIVTPGSPFSGQDITQPTPQEVAQLVRAQIVADGLDPNRWGVMEKPFCLIIPGDPTTKRGDTYLPVYVAVSRFNGEMKFFMKGTGNGLDAVLPRLREANRLAAAQEAQNDQEGEEGSGEVAPIHDTPEEPSGSD